MDADNRLVLNRKIFSCYLIVFVTIFSCFQLSTVNKLAAQNVGIGTSSPANRLHVSGTSTLVSRFENTVGTSAEVEFKNNVGIGGYIGLYQDEVEIVSLGTRKVHLGVGLAHHLTIETGGNVGIGTIDPTEKLDISAGNIILKNSNKGIILNANDAPVITRGWDVFSSGAYTGLGRWGLFMEPQRLTLGIPNLAGKGVEIARYNANSTRITLLTVDINGEINRPATGAADLIPVCMGSVRWNNGSLANTPVINGTGNFTLTPYAEAGMVEITISGHYYTTGNYVTQVTCIRDTNYGTATGFGVAQDSGNGKLRVYTFINGDTQYSRSFHFVVYKLL